MLELLDTLGRGAGEALWLPVLAWTALWLVAEAAFRLGTGAHPLVRYRAAQAVLFALPLSFAAAPLLDPAALGALLYPPEIVTVPAAPLALVAVAPEATATAVPVAPPALTLWMALGALTLVAALAAAVGLWRLGGHALALARLRRALPEPDAPGPVRVVTTPAAPTPMTFGLWRPVVVLPAGLAPEPRALALRHEMVHVRRRDALSAWLEGVTAAVFAAHPGVRRLARRCGLLRELACDAALLAQPEVRPGAYAALVSRFAAPEARPALAVGMATPRSHLHQRITAMTAPAPLLRRSSAALGGALAVLLLLGASLTVTASRALAQEARVIVRTVEAADPPVVIVDGVRMSGGLAAIPREGIHSVKVLRGREAQDAHGASLAIVVTTTAEAERLGLPAASGETRISIAPDGDGLTASDETTSVTVREIEVDEEALERLEERLGELREPMLQLHSELEGPMTELLEEVGPRLLLFRQRLSDGDSEFSELLERLREREGDAAGAFEDVEIRIRALDDMDLPAMESHLGEVMERLREREVDLDAADLGATAIRLRGIHEAFGDGVSSLHIRREGDGRRVTVTLDDGTTREIRLGGDARTPVTVDDIREALSPEAKTGAASGGDAAAGAFPNPASGSATIRFVMERAGTARVRLFDAAGRTVVDRRVERGEGPQALRVDVSGLAPGAYVYRVEGAAREATTGRVTVAR